MTTMQAEPITQFFPEGKPLDLAGEVVSWELKGSHKISFHDVQRALQIAGIDEKYAKEMRPRQAFTRACKDLQDKRVIRITDQDDKEVHFQFNKEEQQFGKYLFPYECEVTLNKQTGVVTCSSYPELEEKIQDLINRHLKERTPSDVTKIVQAIFKERGDLFSIVPDKGVCYLVPVESATVLEQVDTFMDAMGGKLHRFPVPKSRSQSVSDAIQRGLEDLIADLQLATETLSSSTRQSTADKHIKAFQEARAKVYLYSEHLKHRQQDLLSALSEAEQEATDAVNKLFVDSND